MLRKHYNNLSLLYKLIIILKKIKFILIITYLNKKLNLKIYLKFIYKFN
jgi:hypothetical protein